MMMMMMSVRKSSEYSAIAGSPQEWNWLGWGSLHSHVKNE